MASIRTAMNNPPAPSPSPYNPHAVPTASFTYAGYAVGMENIHPPSHPGYAAPSQIPTYGAQPGYGASPSSYGTVNVAASSPFSQTNGGVYSTLPSPSMQSGAGSWTAPSRSSNPHKRGNASSATVVPVHAGGNGQPVAGPVRRCATKAATLTTIIAADTFGTEGAPIGIPDTPAPPRPSGTSSAASSSRIAVEKVQQHILPPQPALSGPASQTPLHPSPPQPVQPPQLDPIPTDGTISQAQFRHLEGDNPTQSRIIHLEDPDDVALRRAGSRLRRHRRELDRLRGVRRHYNSRAPLSLGDVDLEAALPSLGFIRVAMERSDMDPSTHGSRSHDESQGDSDATL